ncbi:MAG: hypothetical protein ABSC47_00180 [Terracidiphilus sp.]
MSKEAVRIAIHLNIHGIRLNGRFQVIDMVHRQGLGWLQAGRAGAVHAMLRSDSRCGFCSL